MEARPGWERAGEEATRTGASTRSAKLSGFKGVLGTKSAGIRGKLTDPRQAGTWPYMKKVLILCGIAISLATSASGQVLTDRDFESDHTGAGFHPLDGLGIQIGLPDS